MSFYRSRETIQSWIDEFAAMDYPVGGVARVIEQDGIDGANTGLVKVGLAHATTGVYIQPRAIGSPWWVVTLEARDSDMTLTPAALMNLASELTTISALCAFLEAKSTAYLRDDPDEPR